jgi:DNA primase
VAISDDDIAKVRDATDFVAIASEHLQLTRAGNRFKGLCPFHSEKSPSFTINPDLKLYYCFGCQAKGDVIRFVMELDHVDFAGASPSVTTPNQPAETANAESGCVPP